MKKTLSLVLALVMVLGSFGTVFAAESVTTGADAGAFLKAAGVLVGDEKGNLNLGDNLSRQDAVILVAQLRGEIKAAQAFAGLPTYEDVKINFYNAPLAWAQENDLFVGHSEKVFGFNEDLTAQEYAKVLLVALGYTVAPNGDSDIKWAEVLTKAQEFGILANLKVENATEITRGEMALMTFNALGVNMKGSKETLADTLGIEMPAPDVLTAEVNDTENLKEVVLELSNAKLADAEKLANKDNYRVDNLKVAKATVEGNNVTLLLEKALVKDRNYDLVVRNIDKAINKTWSFKAYDNASPKVEKVEALGEYGIKVTVSEPVDNPQERNFLVDGKNVAMNIEQFGRVIILTPYHKAAFPTNAEELTIKELEDHAGYKSALEKFEIEISKDTVAPVVVDAIVKGNVVEVMFDKDVYADSVSGYVNRKDEGNISYKSGRQDIFTSEETTERNAEGKNVTKNYGGKIATNVVRYTFDDNLPRRTEVTIEGVQNHSKVTMDKVTVEVREVKDDLEPEIIDVDVDTTVATGTAVITLEFDKNITGDFNANSTTSFDVAEHFALYTEKVTRANKVTDTDYGRVVSAVYDGNSRDTIIVTIDNLTENNKIKEFDYILEVMDFEDSARNRMIRDYVEFEVKDSKTFKVDSVKTNHYKNDTEIVIGFTQPVDRTRAEDATNYIFQKSVTPFNKKDVADLDGRVIVEKDGYTVTLKLPDFEGKKWDELELLAALRDKDGNKISGVRIIDVLKAEKVVGVEVEGAKIVYAGRELGKDKYIVRPTADVVEIKTVEDVRIEVTGDIKKGNLLLDAPNAHVTVNGVVQKITVGAISQNSIDIKGSVEELVVKTTTPFNVYGNVKGLKVIAEETVTITINSQSLPLTKGQELTITVGEDGKIDTDVKTSAQEELNKIVEAVVTTDGAIELEVTTDGAIEFDVVEAIETKVADVKLANGYKLTVKVSYIESDKTALVTITVTDVETKKAVEHKEFHKVKFVTSATPIVPADQE